MCWCIRVVPWRHKEKLNNIGGPNNDKKIPREASKDGFSQLFSSDKKESSEPGNKKTLPPRPNDYDDYWYQAEDGNWYNEYDDLGYQFADEEVLLIEENNHAALKTISNLDNKGKSSNDSDKNLSNKVVPNSKSDISAKKPPKPIDFDDYWYQDETGVWKNEYHDMGYEFEESFYTEEELEKEEAKMLQDAKRESDKNKTNTESKKAVEPTESVINISNSSEKKDVTDPKKEAPRIAVDSAVKEESKVRNSDKPKKQPRPADYDDMWYQDYAGNWFNEYDHDGIEYEDGPSDKVPSSDRETPLKKTKKNVSFEKADTQKEKKTSKSEKSPRERWQWAFSRIVQVGSIILISFKPAYTLLSS